MVVREQMGRNEKISRLYFKETERLIGQHHHQVLNTIFS